MRVWDRPPSWRAWRAAPAPAQLPDDIAHAALWLPPPVKPPQISSRVAACPATNRPGTPVAQSSETTRTPPVPRTVPSSSIVTGKRSVNGSMPCRSKARKKFGWPRRIARRVSSSARSMTQWTFSVSSARAIFERPRVLPAPSSTEPSSWKNVANA